MAIGNEAIFTRDLAADVERHRSGHEVRPGILGMELLRLALERADIGDRRGSTYLQRQPRVREVLDPLQARWLAEVEAMSARGSDADWEAMTRRCSEEAMDAAHLLLREFDTTV